MSTKSAKLAKLRQVPLFAGCSSKELGEIATIADEVHFPSGKVLISEGAPGREFIVILEGTVEVRRQGRRLPQAGDSSFFGEAALLTGAPRNATVTTTSPVATLIITDRAFQRLLKASPTIQGKILMALATRLATD